MSGEEPPKSDGDAETPPEVEAELVEDGPERSEEADTVSAADEADISGQDGARGEATAQTSKRLSPGVMLLIALVVVAALAFGLWNMRPKPPDQADAPQSLAPPEPEARSPAAATPPSPTETEPQAPPEGEGASLADKISNTGVSAAKESALTIEPPPDGTGKGLPTAPPPPAGNEALQQAAKEALRTLKPPAAEEATETVDMPLDGVPDASPELAEEPAQDAPTADAPGVDAGGPGQGADLSAAPVDDGDALPVEASGVADPNSRAADVDGADAANQKISNELSAIKQALASEIERLRAALDAERARAAAQADEIAALRSEIDAALSARQEQEGASAAMEALRAEIDKIKSDRAEVAIGRATAAGFALVALQQRIALGDPYTEELAVLAGFAPGAAGLADLRPLAADGAPTLGALKADFEPALRKSLAAARAAAAKGPWGRFWARLQGLVSIRPARPVSGANPEAILSRAEARLAVDDLDGAVAEVEALSGAARTAIDPWLERARARVNVDRALAALSRALIRREGGS